MVRGIRRLSFTGNGRYSTNIATVAPATAVNGETNTEPAKKAKKKPAAEPSRLLSLLNGNGVLEKYRPKMEAALSPKAKIAMAALLAGAGKSTIVNKMPMAKYTGAKTIW